MSAMYGRSICSETPIEIFSLLFRDFVFIKSEISWVSENIFSQNENNIFPFVVTSMLLPLRVKSFISKLSSSVLI
jgi:hypothetical protein